MNTPPERVSQVRHHTTEEQPPSSLTDAQPRGRATETTIEARFAEIHPLDALAVLVSYLRPDWRPSQVRATLAAADMPLRDLATSAVAAALNPEVHHPNGVRRYDLRKPTPTPASHKCPHGVAAIIENDRAIGVGCTRCRPPTAAMPRCEHGKPYGVGCRTCQESA